MNVSMVVCSGGGDEEAKEAPMGVDQLVQELAARLPRRPRSPLGPFLFAIDHCFAIRGQGTVLTGTVLQVLSYGMVPVCCQAQTTPGRVRQLR